MKIEIPELALVTLIGASGAGKSEFCRRHFKPTEALSSDFFRGLVRDDENAQDASADAFDALRYVAAKRLAAGRLTVVDATNVQEESRRPFLELAREYHCLPVAIVLNIPEQICHERNRSRPDRNFGPHVVRNHCRQLRRSIRRLRGEGFSHVFVLNSPEQVDSVEIARTPLWNNRRDHHGPFDMIGDIHGCYNELVALLKKLGYEVTVTERPDRPCETSIHHPEGRQPVFLGDIVDRGPGIVEVLNLVMEAVEAGRAICVPGNHDIKFVKYLKGRDVKLQHGLEESARQIEPMGTKYRERVKEFLFKLTSHYVLDDGKLVVAHAGMREDMQGRGSGRVRQFALYGETTGEIDEFGLHVRYNWASDYRGEATVVYGHTPVKEPEWLNRTINVDTGCVFGGALTALRWPEKELVSVPAERIWAEPAKPFLVAEPAPGLTARQRHDDLLDLSDVTGKRLIHTSLYHDITIREENSAAALEVMSRFAVNPRWLIYLPPTMSPCATSERPDTLEHPEEAFEYFRKQGVQKLVCEEKHMGSRVVVVICRDGEAARRRFGVEDESAIGVCYTRTGRPFFRDGAMERDLLDRLRKAMDQSGFWERHETDWACLDCELMPWSAKAQDLLRRQYAPVGAASSAGLAEAVAALERARDDGRDVADLLERFGSRSEQTAHYTEAWRRYCWRVESLKDMKLAPFHLLATEGKVHVNRDHVWHMEELAAVCAADSDLLLATSYHVADLSDEAAVQSGIDWWESLTGRGGEGMVVKPLDFVARGERGIIQPAVKCRGREYLRIIYGPEYLLPENLDRLRARGLGRKRSLALREFALGVEGLERFVRNDPLRRVHECVSAVLALESEPVDPRL